MHSQALAGSRECPKLAIGSRMAVGSCYCTAAVRCRMLSRAVDGRRGDTVHLDADFAPGAWPRCGRGRPACQAFLQARLRGYVDGTANCFFWCFARIVDKGRPGSSQGLHLLFGTWPYECSAFVLLLTPRVRVGLDLCVCRRDHLCLLIRSKEVLAIGWNL